MRKLETLGKCLYLFITINHCYIIYMFNVLSPLHILCIMFYVLCKNIGAIPLCHTFSLILLCHTLYRKCATIYTICHMFLTIYPSVIYPMFIFFTPFHYPIDFSFNQPDIFQLGYLSLYIFGDPEKGLDLNYLQRLFTKTLFLKH